MAPHPQSIGGLLNQAAHAARRLAAVHLAPHGLTLPQWLALNALWRDDGQTVGALASAVHTRKPAASRLVERMEQAGLVRKEASDADARSIRVFLTDRGRAKADARDMHARVNDALLQGFSPAERQTMTDLLLRLAANGEAALFGIEVPDDC